MLQNREGIVMWVSVYHLFVTLLFNDITVINKCCHTCKGISNNSFTSYINLGAGYQPVSNVYLATFKAGVTYRYWSGC